MMVRHALRETSRSPILGEGSNSAMDADEDHDSGKEPGGDIPGRNGQQDWKRQMGSVVKLPPRRRKRSRSPKAGGTRLEAEILFFTGVRRERIETAATSAPQAQGHAVAAEGSLGR